MDLTELCRQHEELHVVASQLSRAIADEQSPQRVGALRWPFARMLMTHLALEDRIFYPGIQRMADERLRGAAHRLQVETGPLADDFSAYMKRWNDDRVSREWADFCRETREILSVLIARIDKEERTLLPLLNRNREQPARSVAPAEHSTQHIQKPASTLPAKAPEHAPIHPDRCPAAPTAIPAPAPH